MLLADSEMDFARDTLKNISKTWKWAVLLETSMENHRHFIKWDGKEFIEREVGTAE
jgi:hypothetical protein